MTTYYKVLGTVRESIHGGGGRWTPGRWRSVSGPLVPCHNGLNVVTFDQLVPWLGPTIWRVEVDETQDVITTSDKLCVRRARITTQVTTWNERTARLFAADCAEHVLPFFEAKYPKDTRPREAIAVARRYAEGEATLVELLAAESAAWVAASAAQRAAADAAVVAVAESAARAAQRAAAVAVAVVAVAVAESAASTARAAGGAGRAAERVWQTRRLREYLGEPA